MVIDSVVNSGKQTLDFIRTLNAESSPAPKSLVCSFTFSFGAVIQSALCSGDCGHQLLPHSALQDTTLRSAQCPVGVQYYTDEQYY